MVLLELVSGEHGTYFARSTIILSFFTSNLGSYSDVEEYSDSFIKILILMTGHLFFHTYMFFALVPHKSDLVSHSRLFHYSTSSSQFCFPLLGFFSRHLAQSLISLNIPYPPRLLYRFTDFSISLLLSLSLPT